MTKPFDVSVCSRRAWFLFPCALLGVWLVLASALAAAAQETKLTILWRANFQELETMRQALDAFEARHPGVKVDLFAASGREGEDQLRIMFASGEPPDIFASVFQAGLVDYLYQDMLLDLTPYIERDQYDLSDFFPGSVATFTFNGRIYGLPRGGVGVFGFYNVDLFNEAGVPPPTTSWEDPGWTWDYVAELGKKLTRLNPDGTYAQAGIDLGISGDLKNKAPLMWGTTIFPESMYQYGIARETNLTSELVVESYQRMLDLRFVDRVAPAPGELPPNRFPGGQVGMYFNLHSLSALRDVPFAWSIMPLPRGRADIQQMSTTYTGPFLIAKTTKHPDLAWELLKFLVSEEGQRYIAPGAVVGTSRLSLIPWYSEFFPTIPQEVYFQVTQGAYIHGFESLNVRVADWPRINAVISSIETEMWQGRKDPKVALEEMNTVVTSLIQEIYDTHVERARHILGMP